MSDIDPIKFNKANTEAMSLYKDVGNIWCPYFKEQIAFNAKGLKHLKFQGERKARLRRDQYTRLRLLSLAPQIVKDSHTLQGVSMRKNFERMNINGRWETRLCMVIYYEFVAVIKDVRVRVIVKQVENHPKYFWSIIPFWKMDKITGARMLSSGKPETD